MNDSKKKALGVGLLVICLGSIIEAGSGYHWQTPSIGWMLALGSTWALIVWLWPDEWQVLPACQRLWAGVKKWGPTVVVITLVIGVFLFAAGAILNARDDHPKESDQDRSARELMRSYNNWEPPTVVPAPSLR